MADTRIEFANIAVLYGSFFLSQAYGYAHGCRQNLTVEVKEAVLFGARHLCHIFQPQGNIAWPLTPVLCAPLLLVALYAPYFASATPLVDYSAAALLVVSVMGALAALTNFGAAAWAKRGYNWLNEQPGRIAVCYFFGNCASIIFLGRWFASLGLSTAFSDYEPLSKEMISHGTVGWIFFVVYLGSRYDGANDASRGCNLAIKGQGQSDG